MVYILKRLIGRVIPRAGCLSGRNNTPLRNSETLKLVGYVNSTTAGNLSGYNAEGKGHTA